MYKHERYNKDDDDDDSESDYESDSDDEFGEVNVEELKPVLGTLLDVFDKLSISLKKHFGPLKFDMCDFEARNQNN